MISLEYLITMAHLLEVIIQLTAKIILQTSGIALMIVMFKKYFLIWRIFVVRRLIICVIEREKIKI